MSKRIRVNDGYHGITLPDGNTYDGLIEVVLSDANAAAIPASAFTSGILTLVGSVTTPDPAHDPSHTGTPVTLTREAIEAVLYDKAYSWELQPGSDVPATCIGVLPKIGSRFGNDIYAGLVTISAGVAAGGYRVILDEDAGQQWILALPETPLTAAAIDGADFVDVGATVALAAYYVPDGGQPPYAFPAGWTPGNTTGSGPVLPYLGTSDDGWHNYAGLVVIDSDALLDVEPWQPPVEGDSAYIYAADKATTLTAQGAYDSQPADRSQGPVFLAAYQVHPDHNSPPTALPEGWTFRPYGIGQVAVTDENAGGLIGDIAYVVSGYIYNNSAKAALTGLPVFGPVYANTNGNIITTTTVPEGEVYWVTLSESTETDLLVARSGGSTFTAGDPFGDGTLSDILAPDDFAWPFIERYDLAAKKWLSRIPLPERHPAAQYATTTYTSNDEDNDLSFVISISGPFQMEAGSFALPPVLSGSEFLRENTLSKFGPTTDSDAFNVAITDRFGSEAPVGDPAPYPAGTYWVQTSTIWHGVGNADISNVQDSQALGDSLGTRTTYPYGPYGTEGGIAGVIDGKLYFGGGDGGLKITGQEFFVYDPADDSVTRLADIIEFGGDRAGEYPDYCAYGVVAGKLWSLIDSRGHYICYDPVSGEWSNGELTDPDQVTVPNDQVAGFEIDGKLWFVQDGAAFVFDPDALTVTAKATLADDTTGSNLPFLIGGKIHKFSSDQEGQPYNKNAVYDPTLDSWTERTDQAHKIPSNTDGEFVGVTYDDTPYLFSNVQVVNGTNVLGVYGMTGVALDKPRVARLQDAQTLVDAAAVAAKHEAISFSIITSNNCENTFWLPPGVRLQLTRGQLEIDEQAGLYLIQFSAPSPIRLTSLYCSLRARGATTAFLFPDGIYTPGQSFFQDDLEAILQQGSMTLDPGTYTVEFNGDIEYV